MFSKDFHDGAQSTVRGGGAGLLVNDRILSCMLVNHVKFDTTSIRRLRKLRDEKRIRPRYVQIDPLGGGGGTHHNSVCSRSEDGLMRG